MGAGLCTKNRILRLPYWRDFDILIRLATYHPVLSGFTRRFGMLLFGNYLIYYRMGGSGEGPLNVLSTCVCLRILLTPPPPGIKLMRST